MPNKLAQKKLATMLERCDSSTHSTIAAVDQVLYVSIKPSI